MTEKWKMFFKLTKGYRLLYIGAFVTISVSAIFYFVNPLILRFALDNVFNSLKPENIFSVKMLAIMGGREELIKNAYYLGLFLVMVSILQGLFQFFKGKWSVMASEGIGKRIREKMYEHIQLLPFKEHVKAETGDWIQRCISDVETIRRFFSVQLIEVGRALLMLIIVVPLMYQLNSQMMWYAILAVPIIFSFAILFFIKIKKSFLHSDEAEAALSAVLQENLSGVRVVRAFSREVYEISKFEKVNKDYRDKNYNLIKLLAYYWSISDLICFLQIAGIIVAGSIFAIKGEISVGTVLVFISYESAVLFPIRQMGRVLTDMGKASVSWGRIYQILSMPTECDFEEDLKPEIKGRIQLNQVSMSYNENTPVLKNISMDIEAGKVVALMGPSGSGKSSIVQLLLRLYDYEGSITLDGYELKSINKKWIRKQIGSVLQEPFLYSKTIKDNIKMGRDDASNQEIEKACKIAEVHHVIESFEKGYDTLIGEKGVTLSGGQKQRVAIARAVLRKTPILIFDDSLSAVDTETETQILNGLKSQAGKSTIIIIAHRITSVMNADRIYVMNHGEIVQTGNHESLINVPGMYQRIWKLQSELAENLQKEIDEHTLINEENPINDVSEITEINQADNSA